MILFLIILAVIFCVTVYFFRRLIVKQFRDQIPNKRLRIIGIGEGVLWIAFGAVWLILALAQWADLIPKIN